MSKNPYPIVIRDLLTLVEGGTDLRALVFEIATRNPYAVTSGIHRIHYGLTEPTPVEPEPFFQYCGANDCFEKLGHNFMDTCSDLILEGKKLQAIKMYRTHTMSSLKEAKNMMDTLETTTSTDEKKNTVTNW